MDCVGLRETEGGGAENQRRGSSPASRPLAIQGWIQDFFIGRVMPREKNGCVYAFIGMIYSGKFK